MTSLLDDIQNLMADYREQIRSGTNYHPDPEELIVQYARRRGLLPDQRRGDYQRLHADCLGRLLPPLRDSLCLECFVRDRSLHLARVAYHQLADTTRAVVLPAEWEETWLAQHGAGHLLTRCRDAASRQARDLNDLIRAAVRDPRACTALADRLVVWVRPHLSRIIPDDVRRLYGITPDILADWYLFFADGVEKFDPDAYHPESLHAYFLSFVLSRAWLAVKEATRETIRLDRQWPLPDHLEPAYRSSAPDVGSQVRGAEIIGLARQLAEPYRTAMFLTLPVDCGGREMTDQEAAEEMTRNPPAGVAPPVTKGQVAGWKRTARNTLRDRLE
jgi:hypothetical protein